MSETAKNVNPGEEFMAPSIVDEKLSLQAFHHLSGSLGGFPFVKVVVDKEKGQIHFMNHDRYPYHADYITKEILNSSLDKLFASLDEFNQGIYKNPNRRFFVGIISYHTSEEGNFFTLETVEVDNMNKEMLTFFFETVKGYLEPSVPLLFKPANHDQETIVAELDSVRVPRVYNHQLFQNVKFICLNPGSVKGRLRAFNSYEVYKKEKKSLEWYDIIVMPRVPDDIPRVSGLINADFTTPLSHTNVLASGWQIPNSVQIGILEKIKNENLNGEWVGYTSSSNATQIDLQEIEKPLQVLKPSWSVNRINLEEPETEDTPILPLEELRMSDRFRYGTKAANLGELQYILRNGSERLLGFYRIPHPPRPNLLGYLAEFLNTSASSDMKPVADKFLSSLVKVPRGIAIPFAVQQEFLQACPKIQQVIGKLKMALELEARQVDALCVRLQRLITQTRMPDKIRYHIDAHIAKYLGGVQSFVVRSSSNAEDLQDFSAAGIYESINHVTTADNVFESIKKVWASLLSPRSVRFRDEVGISLDDSYMGVIIQEEVSSSMGGVMVTTNPVQRGDYLRDVYFNVSSKSVNNVVQGSELPYQYLFNTIEGGGRTLSLGNAQEDLPDSKKVILQKLAVAGRLLQSHFSPDYTFRVPLDIEWIEKDDQVSILQIRPYH